MQETLVGFLDREDLLEKGQATHFSIWGFPGGSDGKESACSAGDLGSITGLEDPLESTWQPTPVFLPGESPWTEGPGGLQFIGLQSVGHN